MARNGDSSFLSSYRLHVTLDVYFCAEFRHVAGFHQRMVPQNVSPHRVILCVSMVHSLLTCCIFVRACAFRAAARGRTQAGTCNLRSVKACLAEVHEGHNAEVNGFLDSADLDEFRAVPDLVISSLLFCPAYSSASRAQFPFLPIFPDSLCLNRQTLATRVWKHLNNHVEQSSCDSAIFGLKILKVTNAFELTRASMQSERASCQQHAQSTLEGLHTLSTPGSL